MISIPNSRFSPEIEDIFNNKLNCPPGQIAIIHYDYVSRRHWCADAPEVDSLTAADVLGVYSIHNYDTVNQETWDEFRTRVNRVDDKFNESTNPFLPNWNSKTDDRPSPWMNDCGIDIATQHQEAMTNVFKKSAPVSSDTGFFDLIGIAPTGDLHALVDVTEGLEYVLDLIVDAMGESTDDNLSMFRWSRALCTLAGLGFAALRHFAKMLAPVESDWAYWANCTDQELRTDIVEARRICCYPLSLLRADYCELQHVCSDADISPRWIKAILAVHLLKHVRYLRNFNGKSALLAAYRGEYAYITFHSEGVDQTLLDDINVSLKKGVCKHLRIRQVSARNRQSIDGLIDSVLGKIHPRDFPKPRDLKDVPHFVVPKGVKFTTGYERRSDHIWINPGITVQGFAEIDLNTGKVSPTTVTGSVASSINWPRDEMSAAESKTWWANLPKIVQPLRPSQIIRLLIRNVNDLGYSDGFWALLDAMILADLAREQLAGSAVGNSLINEFPLVTVYPMGHTKETTTNQGKTNFARVLVNVLAQGVPVTHAGKTPSAPSQRAAAAPIDEFGTALYDEFQLPSSFEHFLAQAGLQTLSTGGISSPGRAGENGRGASLKHPLFFTVKVSAFPPDIRNRTLPIFMDVIADGSRCSSEELAQIMSGIISNNVRLSALMWLKKNNFVERVCAAKLIQGKFRFDGHLTIAALLTSTKTADDINAYLVAAEEQCNAQHLASDESGLSENIGLNGRFDPVWYFKGCSECTLNRLAELTVNDQVMCLEVMRIVIEDAWTRRFIDVQRGLNHMSEKSMNDKFSEAILSGRMVRDDGWRLDKRKKTGAMVRNGKNVTNTKGSRECVILTKASVSNESVPSAHS